ncbi:dihydrodipicolinate synthase family protein [Bordetella sp. BOR01]|uniref:dihydrodipicolinate synthase family protein n=1 Tax=Bordetella sp. BOR01 TaxID=2854779 RepID=UPI001C440C78|nr:dihydrodipicolinate synthase family protein [Bordetella sp. BOR01]MBV7486822.1 dihydrodipicolinate synthase family protein [Bordetella sp. BOR01]
MNAPRENAPSAWAGLWLPLVTPLRDGYVDIAAMQALARRYAQAGVSGFVLFGSTGEGNLISIKEKFLACDAVRSAAPHLPVVLGVGGVEPMGVFQTIRKLERLQPAGWLVPPPYYLRPAPDGIVWHYRQIAWATRLPVIIYDVAKRTGTQLSIELIEYLCAHTTCVAVKECDALALAALNARQKLPGLCGEDTLFLDHFLQGGTGAMAAAAHVRPDIFMAVMALARAGHHDVAQTLFATLKPVIRLLYQEPNPGPIKKYLASAGLIADELRLPMTPASEGLASRLKQAIAKLPAEHEVAGLVSVAGQRADARSG